jgi:hypothetical protein
VGGHRYRLESVAIGGQPIAVRSRAAWPLSGRSTCSPSRAWGTGSSLTGPSDALFARSNPPRLDRAREGTVEEESRRVEGSLALIGFVVETQQRRDRTPSGRPPSSTKGGRRTFAQKVDVRLAVWVEIACLRRSRQRQQLRYGFRLHACGVRCSGVRGSGRSCDMGSDCTPAAFAAAARAAIWIHIAYRRIRGRLRSGSGRSGNMDPRCRPPHRGSGTAVATWIHIAKPAAPPIAAALSQPGLPSLLHPRPRLCGGVTRRGVVSA